MRYAISLSVIIVILLLYGLLHKPQPSPVYVGVLHSLSGTMANSERPVMEATLLAIEQVNAAGGMMGRTIVPVVEDGASDPSIFADKAEMLISQKHVDAIFGCWTSACRKRVKRVVESHQNILFYPLQYEGMEASPNIIYTGATPNQQIIPAVSWSLEHLGKRVYLVGSDYIFPRVANWLIRQQVALLGGTVVGERYIPLGSNDVQAVMDDLQRDAVDVVINTINGSSVQAFFQHYASDWDAARLPVMSFSLGENEIKSMGLQQAMQGNYTTWSYFQSIESAENTRFIQAFHQRYGEQRVISDPMEAAWNSVHLWVDAATAAQTCKPDAVLATIRHRSMRAPEGIVSIDHDSLHSWKMVRIGQADATGQFHVVWQSEYPIQPTPFPLMVSKEQALDFEQEWYERWNKHWSAP
jgi:urea transport system substrate-binding protein